MTRPEIQTAFLKQIHEDGRQIETAWKELQAHHEDAHASAVLTLAAHRLAGVALRLGYYRIGSAARLIENQIIQPGAVDLSELEKLVDALFVEIKVHKEDELLEPERRSANSSKNVASIQENRSNSLIYLADVEAAQVEALALQVQQFGYSTQTFTRLDDLETALQQRSPTAILIDISFPSGELSGIETVRSLQKEFNNQLPVFFLADHDDVSARLQAIRTDGKNYFVKPVEISAVIDDLDKYLVREETESFRVLIVDDSEVQAKINAMHLNRARMVTRITTNPMDVLHALDEFIPDLLLLDLYMPECTGLELAQVIRQMKTHVSLPIVYLSSETDREKQLAAVDSGGDDFLTKPIKPDHLISAVTSRITRYRQLRALMLHDSLTGLLNHTSFRERLGQEIARSARTGQPLALAMIDIDKFKQINDTYGHAVGDRILKALSHLLTRRLRQSDVIGRYGGEEFVVFLPNTNESTAYQIMNELREAFSLVHHICNGDEFSVTFSCGVATFPERQTSSALSEAADQAMYNAKSQGRNRVLLAGPMP